MLLCRARLLIALVPLRFWRRGLGFAAPMAPSMPQGDDPAPLAASLAHDIERTAARLPFATKCLPRAMALSMLLRRRRIAHRVVFAVRPRGHGEATSRLHAWVAQGDAILIGDEPGPWIEILTLGRA